MAELDDWQIFVAVADAGSLSAAARELDVSLATVSRRLAALERHLGVALMRRTPRALTLTPDGQGVLSEARSHVEGLRALEEQLREAESGNLRGPIRMAAPISFSQSYLGAPLTRFALRWPDVTIDLTLSDRRVDLATQGFDIALRIGQLDDSSLRARRLCDIRLPLVASPECLARYGTPAQPDDLANLPGIGLANTRTPNSWHLRHDLQGQRRIDFRPRMVLDNGDLAREAALAGVGAVLLPDFFVHEDVRAGRLVELLLPWYAQPLGAYLLMPSASPRPARLDAWIETLVEHFRSQPWSF